MVVVARPVTGSVVEGVGDAIAGLGSHVADSPAADQDWSARPEVRSVRREAIVEALRPGPQGWIDDAMSLFGMDWGIDLSRIGCPTTFWHSTDDANSPIAAVE